MIEKLDISYKKIWAIAYPIILGSIAQNIINVTDTAFLGRLGEVALGAGAIGGLFYLAIVMLAFGFGIGAQIIVARRFGEKDYKQIGLVIEHAFWFLFALSLVLFLAVRLFIGDFLSAILTSNDIFIGGEVFIKQRIWGLFLASANISFRAFYIGIGRTKVITYTTIIMASVNVVLDWLLVFGKLGFPEMGIQGAALASVLAEISATLFFVIYTLKKIDYKFFNLFTFIKPSVAYLARILKTAAPMMLQNFVSLGSWFVFFVLVESMGQRELAISNIARSMYVVLMIPLWGFASATNTLISYVVGSKEYNLVNDIISKVIRLALVFVLVIVAISLVFQHFFISIYTNDPVLLNASIPIHYIISVAAIFLTLAFVWFSAVSGTGNTHISLFIEIAVLLFYVSLTLVFTKIMNKSIVLVWSVEIVYGVLMLLFSWIYMTFGKWKNKVI